MKKEKQGLKEKAPGGGNQKGQGQKQAGGVFFYANCTPQDAQSQGIPAYVPVVDWRGVAESADLFARRWQLTAELARLNGLLESLEPENIEAAGRLFAGKGGADD